MTHMALPSLDLPFGDPLTPDNFGGVPWPGATYELVDGVLVVTGVDITLEDLDELPDDGHRYELLDGMLVVSPAPVLLHQRVVRKLLRVLDAAVPAEGEVFAAPTELAMAGLGRLEPDLLVVSPAPDMTAKRLTSAPLLAVEVLSPSTRRFDLGGKKSVLARGGCAHYWVVDPDEPSIIAWDLVAGEYAEVGRASGEEPLALTTPFPVTVVPQRLIER